MDFRQKKTIEQKNKRNLLTVNPNLNEESGIYFLTREDENGFKYAYIGQAKHILTRLAQHMVGYNQHIDLSLKSHGLFSKENPYGWNVSFANTSEEVLDDMEQRYIKEYAVGFQLLNKTSGSQGSGKKKIGEYKPTKGYRDGLKQGRTNLARELSSIAEKHLKIEIRDDKKNNKISQKQFAKFKELLSEGNKEERQ